MATRTNPRSPYSASTAWPATCTAAEQLGDAVYVKEGDVVERATAADTAKACVVGFVLRKYGDTRCLVVSEGRLAGVLSGLVPDSAYFLGTVPGSIVTAPAEEGVILEVGRALSATVLVVHLDPELNPPG